MAWATNDNSFNFSILVAPAIGEMKNGFEIRRTSPHT